MASILTPFPTSGVRLYGQGLNVAGEGLNVAGEGYAEGHGISGGKHRSIMQKAATVGRKARSSYKKAAPKIDKALGVAEMASTIVAPEITPSITAARTANKVASKAVGAGRAKKVVKAVKAGVRKAHKAAKAARTVHTAVKTIAPLVGNKDLDSALDATDKVLKAVGHGHGAKKKAIPGAALRAEMMKAAREGRL